MRQIRIRIFPEKSGFWKLLARLSFNLQDGFVTTYTPTESTRELNSAVRLPENRSLKPPEATHFIIENLKTMIQNNDVRNRYDILVKDRAW